MWLVAAAVLLAAAAAWWWNGEQPARSDVPLRPVLASADVAIATVHVSGAVAAPGLVEVPADGRVADAVAAAGGALPSSDLSALNLAAPVRDGEQLVVPAEGAGGPVGGGGEDGLVRLNQADATAMEALPGVGPVLAARIVAHRDANGSFETPEDLLDVPGIGEVKLAGLRDAIAVP